MEIDWHKVDWTRVDDAVLALLCLTLGEGGRAWKTIDFDALKRLHDKGMISNPVNHYKSVGLTDEGIARAKRLFADMFVAKAP